MCNLGIIHAVHFYLNGLFILLPLVQQCCYIFFFIYIYSSIIIISPLILLQWMWSFHMTSEYCYRVLVLCNKRRRWVEIVLCLFSVWWKRLEGDSPVETVSSQISVKWRKKCSNVTFTSSLFRGVLEFLRELLHVIFSHEQKKKAHFTL